MAQVRAQRPRMSPEWCSIRTNVKSKISSKFLSWGKWIFRNSTAVSPQCLPRFLLNGTYRIQAIRSKIVLFDLVKCASQADSNVIQEKSILLKTKAAAVQFQWRYPFMRTGDGFLSAVRRRMTRSRGELLEQYSAPGPRSIEHCSTLLSNAHWIFKNTPIPPVHF